MGFATPIWEIDGTNNSGYAYLEWQTFGTPTLTLTPNSLTGFTTTEGTASDAQTFTVSGFDLTADATVTAPASFEVSIDGTNYASSKTLAQSGGTLTGEPVTVYVRIAASATTGTPLGIVTVESTDATTQNVAVSGTVNAPTAPEIGVKQGTTAIADAGTYDFGSHNTATETDITFTIENTGTGASTLETLTLSNTTDFSFVGENPATVQQVLLQLLLYVLIRNQPAQKLVMFRLPTKMPMKIRITSL